MSPLVALARGAAAGAVGTLTLDALLYRTYRQWGPARENHASTWADAMGDASGQLRAVTALGT